MIDPVRKLCAEYFIDFDKLPMVELHQCQIAISQISASMMQSTLEGRCYLIVGFSDEEEVGVIVLSSCRDQLRNWRGIAQKVNGCVIPSIFTLQDPYLDESDAEIEYWGGSIQQVFLPNFRESISEEEESLFPEKFMEEEFDQLQRGIHPQYKLAALGTINGL